MKQRDKEIRAITPQLNDKLTVTHDVMRTMRDEDLSVLRKLISIEEEFRARVKTTIPVAMPERREELANAI